MISLSTDLKSGIDPVPSGKAALPSVTAEGAGNGADAVLPVFAEVVEQEQVRVSARRDAMPRTVADADANAIRRDPVDQATAIDPRPTDGRAVPRASSLAMSAAWQPVAVPGSVAGPEMVAEHVAEDHPPVVRTSYETGDRPSAIQAASLSVTRILADESPDGPSVEKTFDGPVPVQRNGSEMVDGPDARSNPSVTGAALSLQPDMSTVARERSDRPPEEQAARPDTESADGPNRLIRSDASPDNPTDRAAVSDGADMRFVGPSKDLAKPLIRASAAEPFPPREIPGASTRTADIRPVHPEGAPVEMSIRTSSDAVPVKQTAPDTAVQKAAARPVRSAGDPMAMPAQVFPEAVPVKQTAPDMTVQKADIRPARPEGDVVEMPVQGFPVAAPAKRTAPDTAVQGAESRSALPEHDAPDTPLRAPTDAARPVNETGSADAIPSDAKISDMIRRDAGTVQTDQPSTPSRDDGRTRGEVDRAPLNAPTSILAAPAKPAGREAANPEAQGLPSAQATEPARMVRGVTGEVIAPIAPRRNTTPGRAAPESAPPMASAQPTPVGTAGAEAVDIPVRRARPGVQGMVREMAPRATPTTGSADLAENVFGTAAPAAPSSAMPTAATPSTAPAMATAAPTFAPIIPGAPSPLIAVPESAIPDAVPDIVIDPDTGLVTRTGESSADLRSPVPTPRLVTADGADVLQEIVRATLVSKGPTTIELSLDPAELGKLDIEMSFKDDRVSILIRGDRDDSLDLMRRSSDDLARMLRQAGLDLDTLNFSQGRSGQQEQGNRFLTLATDAILDGEDGILQAGAPVVRASARLDIRI